jgi:hypothetical protein
MLPDAAPPVKPSGNRIIANLAHPEGAARLGSHGMPLRDRIIAPVVKAFCINALL